MVTELENNNINGFRRALQSFHDELPNLDTLTPILERACSMRNRDEFIEELINIGCDVNQVRNYNY